MILLTKDKTLHPVSHHALVEGCILLLEPVKRLCQPGSDHNDSNSSRVVTTNGMTCSAVDIRFYELPQQCLLGRATTELHISTTCACTIACHSTCAPLQALLIHQVSLAEAALELQICSICFIE